MFQSSRYFLLLSITKFTVPTMMRQGINFENQIVLEKKRSLNKFLFGLRNMIYKLGIIASYHSGIYKVLLAKVGKKENL